MTSRVLLDQSFEPPKEIRTEILDFIIKLQNNPVNPSLHIEPIHASVDKRVRTGRVTLQYRAVLIELHGTDGKHFLLLAVLNHDDAIDYAKKVKVGVNPVNGSFEVIQETAAPDDVDVEAEIESRARKLAAEKVAQLQVEQETTQKTDDPEPDASDATADPEPAAAAAPATPPRETLAALGITDEALLDDLGLSPIALEAIRRARDEEELDGLLSPGPAWELDAVIGLLSGMTIDEVISDLGLHMTDTADVDKRTGEATDDEIIDTVRKSTQWIEPSETELREIIETGTFAQWRVFLHPSQKAAVNGNHSGSARLIGGAGTGKTVVLVHRAKHLLDQPQPNGKVPRVLLTTFTRDLANQLKTQMNLLDPIHPEASSHGSPGLTVMGIDQLVSAVLRNAQRSEIEGALQDELGISTYFFPSGLTGAAADQLWRDSAESFVGKLSAEKLHPTFLSDEFIDVILTRSITDERDYLRVSRKGRHTPLGRHERKTVWAITRSFVHKCTLEKRLPFPALAVLAASILEKRAHPFFDHAIVDEGQDFHAGHWRFLRAITAVGPNDIYFAEDSHQQIYGHRLVLSNYGIHTRGGASRRLRLNYRTTAENLSFASAILDTEEWYDSAGEPDTLKGYRSLRRGVPPTVHATANKTEESAVIVRTVQDWLAEETPSMHIGILARARDRVRELTAALSENDITVSTDRSGASTIRAEVSVMTMHNAKGMEFTHVILAGVSDKAVPMMTLAKGMPDAERDDFMQRERALLYVAASRARDELVITTAGAPSVLLPKVNDYPRSS